MSKWRVRLGYGMGDLGCNLVFSTMASYLMVFYTDVFGIAAAAAGTMMLVTKFIDAMTDTAMGIIVDHTHTRWGQGRPYFLIGAVPFAFFTFLTFYIPDFGPSGKLAWAYITYCLLCTAYTVVNIPLNTIVPRLTSDVHERDILVSTRMICAMIGTAIVMTITQPLVNYFGAGNEAHGYLITMTVYGIAAMFIFFFTFSSTKEVVPPTVNNEHMSLKDSFKGLTSQAWILFLLNFFYFSLYVVRNTTVIYYFKYNLDRPEWLALVGILGILSGLPMLLVLPTLEQHFKKRSLMFLSVGLYAFGDLLIYFGQNSAFCLLAGLVITGLGIYGIFGITFAIQPDVIDYSEYKKNKSIAGLIAAFQGFFVKGGMGVTSFLIGLFLNLGGYIPNAVQSNSALAAIETCFIWIPIVFCIIIAALIYFYRLDYIRDDMTAELDLRRQLLKREDEHPELASALPAYDPKVTADVNVDNENKNKTLITISRQYGSGGREIAEMLTKRLHCHHYNSKIVSMAAERLQKGENMDDAIANSYNAPENALGSMSNYVSERVAESNLMYIEQAKVILNIADRPESAIFLGRCADYILRNRDDVYSFFIYADDDFRTKRGKTHYHGASLEQLNKEEERRKQYYEFYTGRHWGDPQNYDLMINTSKLSLEEAADVILAYVQYRCDCKKSHD